MVFLSYDPTTSFSIRGIENSPAANFFLRPQEMGRRGRRNKGGGGVISRYTLPEMGEIWSEQNRFKVMLDVEVAACEAMAELNLIPKKAALKIRQKARFNLSQVTQFEKVTKHDVTAFLKSVGLAVGPEARFIHKGLTSSDVLDTALSLQMKEALSLLIKNTIERSKPKKRMS